MLLQFKVIISQVAKYEVVVEGLTVVEDNAIVRLLLLYHLGEPLTQVADKTVLLPKHMVGEVTIGAEGFSTIVTDRLCKQSLASLTLIVCGPAAKPLKVAAPPKAPPSILYE